MVWLLVGCSAVFESPSDQGSSDPSGTSDSADPSDSAENSDTSSEPLPACTAWGESATTGIVVDVALNEISGVAPSIRNPGVLWVVEDRNNESAVIGLDEFGNTLITVEFEGVLNEDMEDVDVVPCGETTCIVVADTGDNAHDRPDAAFVVVEEPPLGESRVSVAAASYRFTWPGDAEDNESLTHTNDGRLVLATKRNDLTTEVYTLPAFVDGAVPTLLASIATAPPETEGSGTQVTAISMWPDQSRLLVRTYREAFELGLSAGVDGVSEAVSVAVPFPAVAHVEAVAYDAVRRGYWTIPESTPEGPSPIYFVPCVDGLE